MPTTKVNSDWFKGSLERSEPHAAVSSVQDDQEALSVVVGVGKKKSGKDWSSFLPKALLSPFGRRKSGSERTFPNVSILTKQGKSRSQERAEGGKSRRGDEL